MIGHEREVRGVMYTPVVLFTSPRCTAYVIRTYVLSVRMRLIVDSVCYKA